MSGDEKKTVEVPLDDLQDIRWALFAAIERYDCMDYFEEDHPNHDEAVRVQKAYDTLMSHIDKEIFS